MLILSLGAEQLSMSHNDRISQQICLQGSSFDQLVTIIWEQLFHQFQASFQQNVWLGILSHALSLEHLDLHDANIVEVCTDVYRAQETRQ